MRESTPNIVLIEPWYEETGHLQFNRAFVSIIREGFPDGEITFACSRRYRNDLEQAEEWRNRIDNWIDATAWTQSSIDGGVKDFWLRLRWLVELLGRINDKGIAPTHLVVLGSSGPLILAIFAARVLRTARSCGTFAILHGAHGIIDKSQPRNPLRRLFTLKTAIKLLSAIGVKVIASEMFIADKLRNHFPKQKNAIRCIPMGYDETESLPDRSPSDNAGTVRVLFLGQATPQKGFLEFIKLAEVARASGVVQIDFRAAGAVRRDTQDIDQSALSRPAGDQPLKRREMLSELAIADVVFIWQSEYYETSSSGVLLDCIGLGVPLVGRRSPAVAELEAKYGACGLFASDIESLFSELEKLEELSNRRRQIFAWKENLLRARFDRSAKTLGPVARRELES